MKLIINNELIELNISDNDLAKLKREVCGLELDQDIEERVDALLDMSESACYSWFNKKFIMVCERPTRIALDGDGQLHWDHGKAIEWPDGWGLYMIHGVRFNEDEYWKIINGDFTIADLANIGSVEKAAAAITMLGVDTMIKEFGAELVSVGKKYQLLLEKHGKEVCDEYYPCVNNEPTKIYKVENYTSKATNNPNPSGDTKYFMVMSHPSLDNPDNYLEWLPDDVDPTDPDLAQANAFGINKEQYMIMIEA